MRSDNIDQESELALLEFGDRNLRLLELFRAVLAESRQPFTFLDYGAGNAHISRTFKTELGENVAIYCLEPNQVCQSLYEKHGLIRIESLDSAPKDIDLTYMIEVIEHVTDPVSSLKEVRDHLSPSGKLFLSTPQGWHHENKTNAFETPSHIHFFTARSLNLALRKSGLTAINYRYYPEIHCLPVGMKQVLRSLVGKTVRRIVKPYKGIAKERWSFQLVGFTSAVESHDVVFS